jgi:hypothetical protein
LESGFKVVGKVPAAPLAAVPTGLNRTPATASLGAASPAGLTAARSAHKAPKFVLQRDQRLVHKPSDRSQRMIRPNPLLKIDVAEKLASPLILIPHHLPSEFASEKVNNSTSQTATYCFNSLASAVCRCSLFVISRIDLGNRHRRTQALFNELVSHGAFIRYVESKLPSFVRLASDGLQWVLHDRTATAGKQSTVRPID